MASLHVGTRASLPLEAQTFGIEVVLVMQTVSADWTIDARAAVASLSGEMSEQAGFEHSPDSDSCHVLCQLAACLQHRRAIISLKQLLKVLD